MAKKSCSSELYSHPGTLLEDHLISVRATALENYAEYEKAGIKLFDEAMKIILNVITLCHDVGKATSYFQEKLLANSHKKIKIGTKKEKETEHHSLFSSVIAYFVAREMIKDKRLLESCLDSEELKFFYSFAAYFCVKNHHSNLRDALEEATVISEDEIEIFESQVGSIDEKKFECLSDALAPYLGMKVYLCDVKKWIEQIIDELKKCKKVIRKIKKEKELVFYFKLNFLFSMLIDADKTAVVLGKTDKRKEIFLTSKMIDEYKKKKNINSKDEMGILREQAFLEVMQKEIPEGRRLLSINLPTGMGKTLCAIGLAFKLRQKLLEDTGVCPRVIYALPYLSIIEQNAEVFEEVLKANGINVTTDVLLKHHNLSEEAYKKHENGKIRELEVDEASILIENWSSEIIVTTFVQLFQTLISNRNKMLKKFHRFSNAVIIMDELQTIPYKYWLLLRKMLDEVAKLNSYLIMITATQPPIFEEKEVFYIVDANKYFNRLERVVIKPRLEKEMRLEEFINEEVEIENSKSYLFILNTIKSAVKVYELFKEKLKLMGSNEEISFLSTHIVPKERKRRIAEIREKNVRFCVSTQLIEAGVDIDFDVVYRDVAPMDSINQAAGRCNRNAKKSGVLYVVSLVDEQGGSFGSRIYEVVQIKTTIDVLAYYQKIEEPQFEAVINKYYKRLNEIISQRMKDCRSENFLESIRGLMYDRGDEKCAVSGFKLIDEKNMLNVFVELDEDAKRIWKEYLKIKEIKNLFERRKEFKKIKAKFYDYIISLRNCDKLGKLPPIVEGFGYVSYAQLGDYYDEVTGYKVNGKTFIW